MIKER